MSWTFEDLVTWLPEGVATAILLGAVGLYAAGFIDLLLGGVHYLVGSLLFGTLLIVRGRVDLLRSHKKGEREGLRDKLDRSRDPYAWNRLGIDNPELNLDGGRMFRAATAIYLMVYAIATYLAMATPVRPTAYFTLVIMLFLIVAIQITVVALTRVRRAVVLLELLAANLSLVYSLSIKYYLYFGDTDALVHLWYVRYVLRAGSTQPIEGLYENFPLWYILSAGVHLVTGPGFRVSKSIFLIGGAVGLLAVLGSYALARRLFAVRTTALYCALLVATSPTVVFYSTYAIPRSVIGSFVPLYLLLLLDVGDVRRVGILLMLFGVTVVYHPASIQFLIPIFVAIAVLLYYAGPANDPRWRMQLRLVGVLGVATVVYWVFQSPQLIQALTSRVVLPTTGGGTTGGGTTGGGTTGGGLIRTLSPEAGFLQIVDRLYFGPLLALLLVGTKSVLRERAGRRAASVAFAVAGLGFFFIATPGPLSLISKFLEDFAFTRWWLYVYPLVLMLCGVGLTWLRSDNLKTTGTTISVVLLLLLLLLLPAVSGYSVAPDNPIVDTDRKKAYFSEPEVTAFNHVVRFKRGQVYADHHTDRYFQVSPYSDDFLPLVFDLSTRSVDVGSPHLAVFRYEEARERSIRVRNQRGTEIRVTASDLEDPLSRHNRVYTNGPAASVFS